MFRLQISHPQAYFVNCVTRCYAHFGIPSCLHPWNTCNYKATCFDYRLVILRPILSIVSQGAMHNLGSQSLHCYQYKTLNKQTTLIKRKLESQINFHLANIFEVYRLHIDGEVLMNRGFVFGNRRSCNWRNKIYNNFTYNLK